MQVDKDSFSSGQIGSKLWLCEELESLFEAADRIVIYGGWYGLTAFLLRARNNIKIKQISSIDVDPTCEQIADNINEFWKWQSWQFKAHTMDCNLPNSFIKEADLLINTSTEHFDSLDWYNNIPDGKTVALQGADMKHDDHIFEFSNLENFAETFQLSDIYYKGEKNFKYPDWEFNRFMLIGKK